MVFKDIKTLVQLRDELKQERSVHLVNNNTAEYFKFNKYVDTLNLVITTLNRNGCNDNCND